MLQFIKDKSFLRNLFFAVFTLILLFFLWLKWLNIYTDHNHVISVPDLNGVHINALDSLVKSYALRYEIIDSVFYKSHQRGVVVNQDPLPNVDVKKNRRIYLTITSLNQRKVNLPDIYDLTLRQAVSKLQKNNLVVGRLEYRADIATNKVLAFKVNGIEIKVGQELYCGTIVDLVVGQGLSSEKILVPNLVGLSRWEANTILKSNSLNVGLEHFTIKMTESDSAVIYKQYPEGGANKSISIGSSIDLYFGLLKTDSLQ